MVNVMPDYWRRCFEAAMQVLTSKAVSKGYTEPSRFGGTNPVFDFVEREFQGHAGGEIVYKALRYKAKHDPDDLVKIAAWAALMYAAHCESGVPPSEDWNRWAGRTEGLQDAPTQAAQDGGPTHASDYHAADDISVRGAEFEQILRSAGFGPVLDVMAEITNTRHRHFPVSDERRLAILNEEALEVTQVALGIGRVLDGEELAKAKAALKAELTQLAAVCIRWLNRISAAEQRDAIKEI